MLAKLFLLKKKKRKLKISRLDFTTPNIASLCVLFHLMYILQKEKGERKSQQQ